MCPIDVVMCPSSVKEYVGNTAGSSQTFSSQLHHFKLTDVTFGMRNHTDEAYSTHIGEHVLKAFAVELTELDQVFLRMKGMAEFAFLVILSMCYFQE